MYKKSEKCTGNTSLMTEQNCAYLERGLELDSNLRKRTWRKFAKISTLINTFCILFAAGNSSAWAHGGGGFHGGGGGFHGQGGFEWGSNSRESAGMYHRNNDYSAWGSSGSYREGGYYHGSLGGSSYGTMHPFQEHHPQTIHPFNQTSTEIGHFNGVHHGESINKEFSGNANWINHNNWHGSYWHGSYWHGSYWAGGAYWGPGPYWGWGNGFFYGALFGATLTTALFLPPVYAGYYYVPLYYYPGPYDYTILVSNYSVVTTPPLRPAPQKVETWVPVKNGHIPVNAVLNNIVNKKSTYYCRVTFHGKTSYGVLIPNDGCYIEEPSVTMRFSKYDILVSSIVG
ncbi:hypothetical protein Lgra_0549 [Legionella gratiana]|uniref:Uncharacterized protein n=1 Tax=Legionella gratiana TaxID=45066 RepID=A0A378J3J2_9GAMM|nr:hypothetical protein [Legionella gratiana]KTD14518.1 hypothetical protein Lgra_0549 [Legionella gratiana]STX41956.1 Uncharacterised protein [Legionella gratiana]